MTLSRITLLALTFCALGTGCPPKGDDTAPPEADTDADTDTDTDTDADADADADSDSDADADSDTDTDTTAIDDDGDGYTEEDGDCDDTDETVSPDAEEVPYDGVDNDCDETTLDDDLDEDGFVNADDCDDSDASINPDAEEDWTDGVDNNCDGEIDEMDGRFRVEELDTSCDCGTASAIDIDSAGQVHVAYYDNTNGYLRYKLRDSSGVWGRSSNVLAYSYAWTGFHLDAACSGSDEFQVAYTYTDYYGWTELDFIYRDAGGSWSSEYVVDDYYESKSTSVGWFVDIDIDSSNLPSFAYFDEDFGVPMVADFTSFGVGVYAPADIYTAGPTGYGTSLAIDSTGADHIAFYDPYAWYGLSEEIQYSQLNDDLASIAFSETVSSDPGYSSDDGMRTSTAVRSDDTPCVAWWDYDDGDLNYACRDDGWNETTVDSLGSVGAYPSLAFNSVDQAYISYYDVTNTNLKVAHYDGSSWTTLTVDDDGSVGKHSSLSIGPMDVVHISYYDESNGYLKYATGF